MPQGAAAVVRATSDSTKIDTSHDLTLVGSGLEMFVSDSLSAYSGVPV